MQNTLNCQERQSATLQKKIVSCCRRSVLLQLEPQATHPVPIHINAMPILSCCFDTTDCIALVQLKIEGYHAKQTIPQDQDRDIVGPRSSSRVFPLSGVPMYIVVRYHYGELRSIFSILLVFWPAAHRCMVLSLYRRVTVPPRTAMPGLLAWSPVAAPRSTVGANSMFTTGLRWKSAYTLFLALLTATWCCCCQQEARVCNDESAATHSDADPMATYPRASDKSTRLVGELLSPFSLQDFAEKHWERMPLIIRGRCVIFDIDAVLQNSGTLVLYY